MINFSLSKPRRKALPETVTVDGSACPVNTDFRTILKILRMFADGTIPDAHKPVLLCRWFFCDPVNSRHIDSAVLAFRDFLRRGDTAQLEQGESQPVFDFEQDASEIYASFLALYGIDLIDVAELHWWRFSALLDGALIGACALSEKIRLRTLDPAKCSDPVAVRRMQDRIRIETQLSGAEQQMHRRLKDILTCGGDVSAALEAFKNEL